MNLTGGSTGCRSSSAPDGPIELSPCTRADRLNTRGVDRSLFSRARPVISRRHDRSTNLRRVNSSTAKCKLLDANKYFYSATPVTQDEKTAGENGLWKAKLEASSLCEESLECTKASADEAK